MNVFKRIRLFFLFHNRNYRKILILTSFDVKKVEDISSIYLKYQAYSSFYSKNYHHAQMCLEILNEKNKLSSKDCNLLAYIYARRNEKDKAISTWCKALEKQKWNRLANKALEYIRSKGRDINLIEDEFFDSLIPKEPFLFPIKFLIKTFILLLIIGGLSILSYFGIIEILKYQKINKKTDINKVLLPDFNTNLLEKPKDNESKYSYDEKEIKRVFEKIKSDIISNKVVSAQIGINKIKMSNASLKVKYKVDILESMIDEPDYALFKNEITYNEYLKEKSLYQNIYILWEGRVVNLNITKNNIIFDLVLGDEKNGIVEGIIPVIFEKAVILKNNDRIKLFGKIKLNDNKKEFIFGRNIIKNIQ